MKVLIWGKDLSQVIRNKVILKSFDELNIKHLWFQPKVAWLAYYEACLKKIDTDFNYIWVPTFRHRDLPQALKFGKKHNIPVIFDPHISSYNKEVFEKKKISPGSKQAKALLKYESTLMNSSSRLIADTESHKDFYYQTLKLNSQIPTSVIPVSVDEDVFFTEAFESNNEAIVYFYGSGIPLQGIDTILDALKIYQGPKIKFIFQSADKTLESYKETFDSLKNDKVTLELLGWGNIEQVASTIRKSTVVLGIFGDTPQASMVIPNKVFQPLASGRVVLTRESKAYEVIDSPEGIYFVAPNDAKALAEKLKEILDQSDLSSLQENARAIYEKHFSNEIVTQILKDTLV